MNNQSIPCWICFDLHTHSYNSKCDRPGRVKDMSAEDFVDVLFKEHIDVFSVTDHNCFNAKYYEKLKVAATIKHMKVIYGSEMNVYVSDKNQSHFQMGVYFDDKINLSLLEAAIEDLYCLGDGKLPTKFPKFSEIMEKLFSLKTGFIIIPEANGLNNIYKIIDDNYRLRLQNDGFQKVFSGFHAGDSFNKTGAENWAFSFYKLTRDFEDLTAELSPKETEILESELKRKFKDNKVIISEKGEKIYKIIQSFSPDYAYFHFSDWHNKEEYNPKFKNYLFGDRDIPFDTLSLACDDPESRILVKPFSEEKPIIMSSYLKELRFEVNGKTETVFFTPGLNAIVGQRASGKTFLLSIIKKLSDANDKDLNKYSKTLKVDISSIVATTYGGQEYKPGNLAQVSFINQNEIAKIYEDPQGAFNGLKKYFPDCVSIDFSGIDKIKTLANQITLYDTNYRAFSGYITSDIKVSSFSYESYTPLNVATILSAFNEAIKKVELLENEIVKTSISSKPISEIIDSLNWQRKRYQFLCTSYNQIISLINETISRYRQEATFDEGIQKQMSSLYIEGMNVFKHNFDILLSCKKLIFLLSSFSPMIPDYSLKKQGQYLFITGNKLSSDSSSIHDALFNSLTESINRGKYRGEIDDSIFLKYAEGNVQLKNDRTSLCDGLTDEFKSKSVKTFNSVYEIKDKDVMFDSFISCSTLNEYEKNGTIDNISDSSPGKQSAAYISIILGEDKSILVFDQPEDNIDNVYISEKLVPLLKRRKMQHQLIFVTHNPSVAVFTDAFNYIFVTNSNGIINYANLLIERKEDKEEIMDVLDGGRKSFSNRNQKYGEVLGGYSYGNKITD